MRFLGRLGAIQRVPGDSGRFQVVSRGFIQVWFHFRGIHGGFRGVLRDSREFQRGFRDVPWGFQETSQGLQSVLECVSRCFFMFLYFLGAFRGRFRDVTKRFIKKFRALGGSKCFTVLYRLSNPLGFKVLQEVSKGIQRSSGLRHFRGTHEGFRRALKSSSETL